MSSRAHARGGSFAPGSTVTPELRERFIDHRERDVAAMVDAMRLDDFDRIARFGHNMRGTGASYGYPDVSAIGEQLEAAARRRDLRAVAEQVVSLGAWVVRTRAGGVSESCRRIRTAIPEGRGR